MSDATLSVLTVVVTSAVAVAINFATDSQGNILIWAIVVLLVGAAGYVAYASSRATRLRREHRIIDRSPDDSAQVWTRETGSLGSPARGHSGSVESNRNPSTRPLTIGIAIGSAILLLTTVSYVLLAIQATQSPPPPPQIEGTFEGNCNIQGDNSSTTCISQAFPAQIGDVRVEPNTEFATWLFLGTPDQLPTPPPDYPAANASFHCPDWVSFLTTNQKIYAMSPGGDIRAQAGLADQVSIINVETMVQKKQPLGSTPITYIQCNHGAGSDKGYEIRVDTRTQKANLYDFSNDSDPKPAPMPPASLQMDDRRAANIVLTVDSDEEYLYTGVVIVTAVVNGQEKKISIGTPSEPYRWVKLPDSELNYPSRSQFWDWDLRTRRWTTDFSSFFG